jgi:plasmid maintenance system antidote protein VapI
MKYFMQDIAVATVSRNFYQSRRFVIPRGVRSKLAQSLQCQTSHISQVLSGRSEFTLEQAEQVSTYIGHSKEETEYFLLLVQVARSGTRALQKIYSDQIQKAQSARLILKNRFVEKKHSP